MLNNNALLFKTICTQTEIILSEFEKVFNEKGFLLISAGLFRVVFVNYSSKKTITFYLEDEYKMHYGIQPLRDITLKTSQEAEVYLSVKVNEIEYYGAFRNYFKGRLPGQSIMSVFKDLVVKYFFDEENI